MNVAIGNRIQGSSRGRIFLFASLCVTLSIFLAWQTHNEVYPHDDEGDYFFWAQQMLERGRNEGPLAALKQGYVERGFRPVLQPYVGLPFLAAENGAVLRSAREAETFVYLVFATFCAATLFLFLPPGAAALSAVLLATFPTVLTPFLIFSSDSSFLAANAALVFFAIRSERLKKRRYALLAGAALGIGSCFRPVEALVQVNLAAIAAFLYLCWRAKTVAVRDLVFAAVTCAATLACLAIPEFTGQVGPSIAVLAGSFTILAVAALAAVRLRISRNFALAFLTALALFLFWFAPTSRQLFDWIYDCSMGDFIKITLPRTLSPPAFAIAITSRWAGPHLFALLAIAMPFAVRDRFRALRNEWLLPVFAFVVVPVLIGSFGGNGETRRYYVQSLLALFALCLVFALNENAWRFRWLRYGIVVLLLAAQSYGLFLAASEPGISWVARWFHLDYYNAKFPEGVPTNLSLVDQLRPVIPVGTLQRIAVYNLPSRDPWFSQRNNPYSLSVRSLELRQNWRFEYVNAPDADLSIQQDRVRKLYQWMLVTYENEVSAPTTETPAGARPDERFSRDLLRREAARNPAPGFSVALGGEHFRLFKITRPLF